MKKEQAIKILTDSKVKDSNFDFEFFNKILVMSKN